MRLYLLLPVPVVPVVQGGEDEFGYPWIVGRLFVGALIGIMLVVPWIMARGRSEGRALDGTAPNRPGPGGPTPGGSSPAFDPIPRSRFTSDRERRLWTWALVLVVAIYSTLSPAQQVAAALRERGLLGATTTAILLLIGIAIAVHWSRTHPGRAEIGAGIGVFLAYFVTMLRMPVPEARSHLFEYGLLAMLIYHALSERRENGRRVPLPALLALLAAVAIGWVDEGIQALLPNRVYDLLDVGMNAAFATMGIVSAVVIGWARRLDVMRRIRRSTPGG